MTASQQDTPPGNQTGAPQQTGQAEQRGTNATPLIVQTQPTAEQAANDKADRESEARERRATLWLTGLLCLITFGTGIVVGWQAFETRKAAEAAKASAHTTASILATTKTIERAWVGVTDMRLNRLAVNQTPSVTVTFKNTGRTPAEIAGVRIKVEIIGKDFPAPQLPAVPDYGTEIVMVPTTLMPDQSATTIPDYSRRNAPLAEVVINDVNAGNANLYIYGCVEYRDKLDQQELRITRFARRYDGPASIATGQQVFYFPKLVGYNEAT